MSRTIEVTVYQFDELSDRAKERAREWMRECCSQDSYGADDVISNWADTLRTLGYDVGCSKPNIRPRPVGIYYSGFYSQGDGACFEGAFYASNRNAEKLAALRADRPATYTDADGKIHKCEGNARLLAAMDELDRIIADCPMLSASLTYRGYYYHKQSIEFDVDADQYPDGYPDDWDAVQIACENARCVSNAVEFENVSREFMRAIYLDLETDYEWQMSDECIDETIRANEYEFDEDGERTR